MPMSIGWPIGATVGSRLLVRYGAKPISLLGIFLLVIGTFCLTLITMATPPWMILGMVFILGLGFGFSITIFTIVVQSAVDWSLRGVATSSNTFLRTLGQTLGVAVLGTFLNHQIGSHADSNAQVPPEVLAAGIHQNFIIVAVLAVICLAITFWLPKKKPQPEPAES